MSRPPIRSGLGMFPRSPNFARYLVAAIVAVAVMLSGAQIASGQTADLDRTKNKINEIKKALAAAKGRQDLIQTEVRRLDQEIGTLDKQIRTGVHDISSLESEIRTAEAKIAELQQQHALAVQASGDRARRLYKQGPGGMLESMLEAESIGEFVRLSFWWEVAAELDGKTMISATRLKNELSDQKTDLGGIKASLEQQRQWLEARRQLVASARSEKSKALAEANAEVAGLEKHIKDLEAESRRLTAELRSRVSTSTGAVSRAGFIWPLNGRVTSPYGYRRGGFHSGIDIDGNTGNPIKASKAGSIVGVACGSGYGICTVIDHGGGVSTLYAHMSRKAVSGGSVAQGQVIGYVGCTGSCSGSHLHFEVRVNGSPRNPRNFLP